MEKNKSLKRMLRLPQSTPSIALRAELGVWAIENVISKKKLCFLHRVLNQPDNNITKTILLEQRNLPEETWLTNTLEICKTLGITANLTDIKNTPKTAWKKLVIGAINKSETASLMKWCAKSKKYKSNCFKVQKKKYISLLPPTLSMIILKARTGMLDLKPNFKNMYSNMTCRKCKNEEETLIHILLCGRKLTKEKQILILNAHSVLRNIEEEEERKIKMLASEIRQVTAEMVLVPTGATLESALQATSDDEDIH